MKAPKPFKQFLDARSIKPAHLAKMMSTEAQVVNGWINRGIPAPRIKSVALALGCTPRELLPYASNPEAVVEITATEARAGMPTKADLAGKSRKELVALIRLAAEALERSL